MSGDVGYRVTQFKPPPRPEWVQRVNEEGRCMDIKGVVPLDADSLISHAKANTGLADFGVDDWREPFEILTRALDEEADLNLMGRLLTRSELLMLLEARLLVEDSYKRHPEIDDEQIVAPIVIVGSGRSGTSMMQNLLAFDPENRTPKHWEGLFPCPSPQAMSGGVDKRVELGHQRTDLWNRITPESASVHEFSGNMPTELIQLEALSFQSTGWLQFFGITPTFLAYTHSRSIVPALQYAKRVLKLLQWKQPRPRWQLKNPDLIRLMPETFQVFPDAHLVWMHRDPIKAVSSAVNAAGTMFWIRSDRPMSEHAVGQITNPANLANTFDKAIGQIEQGSVPVAQIHGVQYLNFVANPVAAVEKMYGDIGIPLTREAKQAMEQYMRENPRESRPPHRYSTGDVERLREERKLFERYQTFFRVRSEI